MRLYTTLFSAPFILSIFQVSALIRSPPLIVKQPTADEQLFQTAVNSEYDKPFLIECEAEAEPAPKYRWQKNGKPFEWQIYDDRISQQPGRGTLVISSPRDEDSGQYQCIAINDFGTAVSNTVFVRKSELESFKNGIPIRLSAVEGDPFKLTCQPPDGWPKPKVHWVIQNTDGRIKAINNSRMTVDPEGNLWFSYVTKDDASKGFVYACAATSVFRNEYKLGNSVELDVISRGISLGQIRHQPEPQYVTRKNEAAVRGKRIDLYCIFGGIPAPEIVWTKDDQPLHWGSRIVSTNYGKSITIRPVIAEDEGMYTCTASNGVGEAKSYSVHLLILAIPVFTVEPEIVNAAAGERAEFKCEAKGVPEPEIKWLHNGRPIEEELANSRRKVNTNSIVIKNLEHTDTGNYGCNASNSLGYVYKDVYLNVLALPPKIEQPPSDEATVHGQTITITCRVFGVPKAEVKWIKNGKELLTGGRYTILESGDLEIKHVKFFDAGDYTCQASNKFGSTEASAFLAVKKRTIITDKPEDIEVAAGSTATFRCNANIDSSLTLAINWMKSEEPIDVESEPRFVIGTDYSLTIMNAAALDSGTYVCIAQTELDEVKSEATLTVQDVPNPPELMGVTCMNSGATVRWLPVGDNRAPILRYTIQFSTSFTPDTWKNAQEDVPATDLTYTVPMTPWANYTFRVLARNKIGASLPSRHSEVCTTPPDVPHKNPDNVQGEGTGPENIVISWEPMPQVEHNGPGFMYQVYYKRDIPGMEWITQEINDWQQHRLQVDNQPTYQRYKIKVVALNERGESLVSPKEVTGYSGEDVPLQEPTNVTVVKVIRISGTTVKFSWDPVPDESVRGFFRGYKVQTWTDNDGEKGMREIEVAKTVTETVISRFVSSGRNYIRVLAYNGRYNGPPSETLSFDMPDGIPGTVQSFDGFPMGSNALYLVWKKPAYPNGIITGYRIYYQEIQGTTLGPLLEREPRVSDPDVTAIKLAGLKPSTKYRLHIRAMTRAGEGEDYFIEQTTRNSKAVQPDVPTFTWKLIPTDDETVTIRITWLPIQGGNPGSHFYVKYKFKGDKMSLTSLPEFNEDYIELRGLAKGQVYMMSIVAVDGKYFATSLPMEVHTSSEVINSCVQQNETVAKAEWLKDVKKSITQMDRLIKKATSGFYDKIKANVEKLNLE